MKNRWNVAGVLILLTSLTACAPVVSTVSLATPPADAAACTVATLRSLGYSVLDESPDAIQGERDKHARSPVTGQGDFDRITVVITASRLRAVGETMRAGNQAAGLMERRMGNARLNSPQAFRAGVSREVREDVASLTKSCGVADDTR